jgi:hypothetical protein
VYELEKKRILLPFTTTHTDKPTTEFLECGLPILFSVSILCTQKWDHTTCNTPLMAFPANKLSFISFSSHIQIYHLCLWVLMVFIKWLCHKWCPCSPLLNVQVVSKFFLSKMLQWVFLYIQICILVLENLQDSF